MDVYYYYYFLKYFGNFSIGIKYVKEIRCIRMRSEEEFCDRRYDYYKENLRELIKK